MLNSIICLRHSSDKKTFPYKTVRYLIIKKPNPKLYLCLLRRISYSMYFVCCRIPLCTRDSWVDLPYSWRSWVKEGHCSRTQWVYHRCTRIPWGLKEKCWGKMSHKNIISSEKNPIQAHYKNNLLFKRLNCKNEYMFKFYIFTKDRVRLSKFHCTICSGWYGAKLLTYKTYISFCV